MMFVLERISLTTKIYQITLDRAASVHCSLLDPGTRPTLGHIPINRIHKLANL